MPVTRDRPLPSSAAPWRLGTAVWLATGAWIGLVPWAPGTWGSLLGLPLAWGIGQIVIPWLQLLAVAGLALVGIPVCTVAAARLGGAKDPGCIVYDEIIGMAATMLLIPDAGPVAYLVGFGLFRLFDISKPPPARSLERLPSGLGIMADDWAAALYANLALRLLLAAGAWFSAGGAASA